jgi:esterase/lipase
VRLIHGLYDEEVPYSMPMKLLENVASRDAELVLLKWSTHSMEVRRRRIRLP